MPKTILFYSKAQGALQRGVDKHANAVKSTLGPKGNIVVYMRDGMFSPVATKDGVTVSKEVDLHDPIENVGAMMLKEVASKTADMVGDGTTTSVVLAQAIITAGLKKVAKGANPVDIKRGIEKAVDIVVDDIYKQSVQIDDGKILNIATISANNDHAIGHLISNAMLAVGKEGVIKVQASKTLDNELKIVEGIEFERGYLNQYFITNHAKKRAELENPFILLVDKKISSIHESYLLFLADVIKTNRPLLIICNDMDGEALVSFAANARQGRLKVCVVRAPGYTDEQKLEYMEDIAALTGTTIVGEETGVQIQHMNGDNLGTCELVTVTANMTSIIGGAGDKEGIEQRIAGIRASLESAKEDREKAYLKSRLAKLQGKVAILCIGAGSDIELGEKTDRVDDALQATKAAVEEGVVPGGGVAYIRAINRLDSLRGTNKDENAGINIIRLAIEEPMRHIVGNTVGSRKITGFFDKVCNMVFETKADNIVDRVKEGAEGYGYNARTEVYEDLISAGVIDPAKVARVALQNAASVACIVLTTECLMVETAKPIE